MTPRTSADYYRRQQVVLTRLLLALRRVWRQMDPTGRWDEQYADGIGAQLVLLVTSAQVAATRDADTYIAQVLNELDFGPETAPGVVSPTGLSGLAGDGRTVEGLLAQAVVAAGQAFTRDYSDVRARAEAELAAAQRSPFVATMSLRPRRDVDAEADQDSSTRRLQTLEADVKIQQARARVDSLQRQQDTAAQSALDEAERFIQTIAATILSDTARAAESAATVQREWVPGYVRMLNPPSCSRCAVLAGKYYRWNAGFLRHPLCDCRHVPASEQLAGDLRTNPDAYFTSLDPAAQERIFTTAGAQAIRDGADISQVVNARRSMQTAQVYGNKTLITREGITVRGAYGRSRGNAAKVRGQRYRASTTPRLMPESIYDIATDRADAIRLLRLNGFIL